MLKEKNINSIFNSPYFHESVIRIPNAIEVAKECAKKGLLIGLCLENYYPELKDCVLVCVTETKTNEDLKIYRDQLKAAL